MSEYRTQERLNGAVTPIVSNNANFVSGRGDVLLSWDDAVTILHEFGHALHALNSNVTYPSLSGTNVVRDFVEFRASSTSAGFRRRNCCPNLRIIMRRVR